MKRKIDFILNEGCYERYIFRFHPRISHCHSFNDNPPKSWSEVYKIYFSYSIVYQQLDKEGQVKRDKTIWSVDCDEDSLFDTVAYACDRISKGLYYEIRGEDEWRYFLNYTYTSFGHGVSWRIEEVEENYPLYRFLMTKSNGVSYVFYLSDEKAADFGQFLTHCCDYMVKHGEPIRR